MGGVREPAVAGLFYPGVSDELRTAVEGYLAAAPAAGGSPKALVAPHAGYIYSGAVAAAAYATLAEARETVRRVILLGPAHRMALAGMAISSATAFATPIGEVPVDAEAFEIAQGVPNVRVFDAPFEDEHSLEVQLPFLQVVLEDFRVLPVLVGQTPPESVAALIDALWGGDETRIIVSSDLSHFHDYETARRLDQHTAELVETLRLEELTSEHACGCHPLRGLLQAARARGLLVHAVDLRSSGDTAGPRSRVVGYGSFVVG
jgi:AmmeMemoRadiSam system protein B